MRPNPSRTIGACALLACFLALPLRAQSAQPVPDEPRPGWQERTAKMAAELEVMQEEAAKNPSRPSIAALQRELDRMAVERQAKISRRSRAARFQWWLTGSFGLNLVLTLALLWALLRRGGAPARAAQAG